eukprot:6202120-Pleurochrysis_carterae.AAC.4
MAAPPLKTKQACLTCTAGGVSLALTKADAVEITLRKRVSHGGSLCRRRRTRLAGGANAALQPQLQRGESDGAVTVTTG